MVCGWATADFSHGALVVIFRKGSLDEVYAMATGRVIWTWAKEFYTGVGLPALLVWQIRCYAVAK